jgi:DNA-binding MarR family transcriptional regulator
MRPSEHDSLAARIMATIQKILYLEKGMRFEAEGVKLYPSEIHVMMLVAEGHATNATKMAQRFGVTKGAISQTITRLESKAVLAKQKDTQNKNELTLSFTPLGEACMKRFLEARSAAHRKHGEYLAKLTNEEREVIQRFLSHLDSALDLGT